MFLTELILAADSQPDLWVLEAPLVWRDAVYGRVEVPIGFKTDLASIPRAVRNLPFLDPCGLSRLPAAAHDWFYAWRGWGKPRADNFLRDALRAQGASAQTAAIYYYGVHWFGETSWLSDAGALESRDFATPQAYQAWRQTLPGYILQPLTD